MVLNKIEQKYSLQKHKTKDTFINVFLTGWMTQCVQFNHSPITPQSKRPPHDEC